MSLSPVSLGPGAMIGRKYRVERVLGQGGMGVVVLATHTTLRTPFAVKIILPELAASPTARQRLMEEAQNASRIPGDHVVRVVDADVLPDGIAYLAMEYLEGHDLAEEIARRRLSAHEIVEIIAQACDAVASAHDLGIVHRDLKPSNIFLTRRRDGSLLAKVLDFGISKDTGDPQRGDLTATVATLGSPLYMSPEQIKNPRTVDGRSDVWSLGVVLYEALAGVPPFQGETMGGLSVVIATEPPPELRTLASNAPAALLAVVDRCLEKSQDARFSDVRELQTALRASVSGTPLIVAASASATGMISPPVLVETNAATANTIGGATQRSSRRGLVGLVMAGAAVLIAAGTVFLLATPSATAPGTSQSSPPSPAAPASTPSSSSASSPLPPTVPAASGIDALPNAPAKSPAATAAAKAVGSNAVLKPPPATPEPERAHVPPSGDCTPPYVLDSNGHKRFKPQCM